MSNHSRAKEVADRYKNYQSTSSSEGWGGAEKKGDDNYIGPNELKAMQRDSGLSANEMNDFFSSEEGQGYFSNKHTSGGSGGKGGVSNTDYLAEQAKQETAAQKFKDKKTQETKDSFNTETNNTDSFNTETNNTDNSETNTGTNAGATNSGNQDVTQKTSSDRDFGFNENRFGDNNTTFGNINQGNQDFSVNISSQNNSGGSGSGSGSGGTSGYGADYGASNYGFGEGTKALMENSYQRSQQSFNPYASAAKSAAAAEEITGMGDRINNLDVTTDLNIDNYRKASDQATIGLYGDIWNMKAPTWKQPGDLEDIETNYDKDEDE